MRRSVSVSSPLAGARPPMRASSARVRSAQRRAPSCSKPPSARSSVSRAGRFILARLRVTPSASSVRASSNGIDTRSCSASAPSQRRERGVGVPASGLEEAPTAGRGRDSRRPLKLSRTALDQVEERLRFVEPAERDQRLDVVEHESHRARFPDAALLEPRDKRTKLPMHRLGIAQRELEQAKRRGGDDGRDHHTALLGEHERRSGVSARAVDLTPTGPHQRAHRERERALRFLAGLECRLVRFLGPSAGLAPLAREELDPCEVDERPRQAALLCALLGVQPQGAEQLTRPQRARPSRRRRPRA